MLLYVLLAVSATANKCCTFDELLHLTLGYVYWVAPSNHLQAENGVLAQAWAALPLLCDHLKVPQETGEPWGNMGSYGEYYRFFYSMGNDPATMLFQARTMISLLGAALGALVFFWSRELFGMWGGFVSLLLFVFCPNMLANGALVTADMAATLGFCAATWAFWKLSHTASWRNLAFSVLSLGFLALAKMSAILMLPIFFLMLTVRFFSGRPVQLQLFANETVRGPAARVGTWSLLLFLHLVGVVAMLWMAYNFQAYSWGQEAARRQILDSPNFSLWNGTGLKAYLLENIGESALLPPAYLEGLSFTLQSTQQRVAFL